MKRYNSHFSFFSIKFKFATRVFFSRDIIVANDTKQI